MSKLDELFDAKQVAEAFGVRRATIYQWARRGLLPCVKVSGVVRFRASELERVLSSEKPHAAAHGKGRQLV